MKRTHTLAKGMHLTFKMAMKASMDSLHSFSSLRFKIYIRRYACVPSSLRLQVLDDIRERLPEAFDMEDIRSRVAELTPYIMVAIQVGILFSPAILAMYFKSGLARTEQDLYVLLPLSNGKGTLQFLLQICSPLKSFSCIKSISAGVRTPQCAAGGNETQPDRAGPGSEGRLDHDCSNGGHDGFAGGRCGASKLEEVLLSFSAGAGLLVCQPAGQAWPAA